MNLIICLDNSGGYSFAGRRQSSDKIQLQDMLELVGENKLFLTEYSANLFDNTPKNVIVCDNPLLVAEDNDYCFIENTDIIDASINKLVIYRWNRAYPSDKSLNPSLLEGKKMVQTIDFVGNSHEKITREIFE